MEPSPRAARTSGDVCAVMTRRRHREPAAGAKAPYRVGTRRHCAEGVESGSGGR
jgi:hypothetical protein